MHCRSFLTFDDPSLKKTIAGGYKIVKEIVSPLELARKYLTVIFYRKEPPLLREILSEDCVFEGPFTSFHNGESYVTAIEIDPLLGSSYQLIRTYEDDDSVCLFYEFSKPGVTTKIGSDF